MRSLLLALALLAAAPSCRPALEETPLHAAGAWTLRSAARDVEFSEAHPPATVLDLIARDTGADILYRCRRGALDQAGAGWTDT